MGGHDMAMLLPDLAASPLESHCGAAAAKALRSALRWPGRLQARGDGWRAQVRCDGADAPMLAASSGLRLRVLAQRTAGPALHWFDRVGTEVWEWHPAPGQGAHLDGLLHAGHGRERRAGVVLPAARRGTTPPVGGRAAGAPGDPLAGTGWDLLLHVAAHGLPLQLGLGAAVRLDERVVLRRVCLDGESLRLECAAVTLWLDETAVWLDGDEPGSALVGHGVRLQVADTATWLQVSAWQHLVDAVRHDRPVQACSC